LLVMARKPTYRELERRIKELEKEAARRKRSDETLDSTHRKLRAVFDAIQENINVVDLDFNLTDVNDVLIKAFGLPDKESVLGRKCFEVLKGRKDICPNCAVAEAYRTKGPVYRTSTAEDEISTGGRTFEIFAYPIIDGDGNLTGAVEFARDSTKHKQAEEALRKAHDKLEQRVKKRTAELSKANERLKREIEERKRVKDALRKREAALKIRTKELEEVNSALRVLLKQRDEDRTKLEENVLFNLKRLVLPYVEKMKKNSPKDKQRAYLSVLESNLNDIVSPFAVGLSSKYSDLTPTEIQTAHLVRDGKTTKEIAKLFNVSVATVESHRKSIRRKIGISKRKANLRSHLLSIQNR